MSLILPPTGLAAIVATPATFGAVETLVHNAKIPANCAQIGTMLEVMAFGTLSAASAGTLLARLRMGTAGTTADAQLCATAATGAAAAAVGWKLQGLFTVRTLTSGGTCIGNIEMTVGTTVVITAQTATVTFNSTVDEFVDLTLIGGGTTPVVTIIQSVWSVRKP